MTDNITGIKSRSGIISTTTIKIIRKYTKQSIGEIKSNAANGNPLYYVNTIGGNLSSIKACYNELIHSGADVYLIDCWAGDEEETTLELLDNLMRSHDETANEVAFYMKMES